MALLRQRGGGLLATGPDAVRANAMREQQRLLGAARAPSVISAPRPILEENPLNSLGQGLSEIGSFLGDMSARKKREDALAAALAPIQFSSMQTVQPAGFFIKDGIEIDPSKSMLPDDLNQAFLREAIQTNNVPDIERLTGAKFREAVQKRVSSERQPTLSEQAARLFQAGFAKDAQDRLSAAKIEQGQAERSLQEKAAKLAVSGDIKGAAGLLLQSTDVATRQAAMNTLKDLAKPEKKRPLYGGNVSLIKADSQDFAALKNIAALDQDLDSIFADLDSKKLDPGRMQGVANFLGNNLGYFLDDEAEIKVAASNKFERFIQRYVNETLRLAKGVQTDNDAKRVINQLKFARSISDVRNILNQLAAENAKNVSIYQSQINTRRRAFGDPEETFVTSNNNRSFKEV